MPFCGFHPKMVTGLVIFAEGLFTATVERAKVKGISVEEAFRIEVDELGAFLEALEERYQVIKNSTEGCRSEIMAEVADWVGKAEVPPKA